MDPRKAPIQTPQQPGTRSSANGYHPQPYTATPGPAPMLQGNDGSQFGAHHGTPATPAWHTQGGGGYGMPSPGRFTSWSEERVAMMQSRLQKRLGPEYVTTRPGPSGGGKLSYIEGWKVVNLANEVFGFNGWSSSISQLKTDFLDVVQDRCFVGITAIVRVTLQDGCFHEDVGYGHAENIKGKAAALEKAQKEAVTDALKRALKHFGNVLGNCLYDKEYTKEVGKMRVGPAKFDTEQLERRPEFTPKGAPAKLQSPPAAVPQPAPPRPQFASAVPQHISGNHKQTMPQSVPQPMPPPRFPSERDETPLRSIDGMDINMDDCEFGNFGDDSFLDLDESILASKSAGKDIPMLDERTAARQPPVAEAPRYQHRHRPDVPHPPQPQLQVSVRNNSSSSESSTGTGESAEAPKRVVGGFAMPNGGSSASTSDSSSAASRRAAMMAAISAGATTGSDLAPTRDQSPRIPSGGIDAVAVRAQTNIHVHGANLEIESTEQIEVTSVKHEAFQSARGVKRDGSQSPSKWDGRTRTAIRSALTELPVQGQADGGGGKRSRIL